MSEVLKMFEGFRLELSWMWLLPPLIGLGIPGFFAALMYWADGGQIQDLPPIKVTGTEDMKEFHTLQTGKILQDRDHSVPAPSPHSASP